MTVLCGHVVVIVVCYVVVVTALIVIVANGNPYSLLFEVRFDNHHC